MSDLGIIPELEEACWPQPGEMCVCWVNRNDRTVGLSPLPGQSVERVVPWKSLRTRRGEPLLQHREPFHGDIVAIAPSRAPARPYRIRVDTGPVGYLWLEWLGACARTAGVAQTDAP